MSKIIYKITKENCQNQIDNNGNVCCGCGGKLKPIETVDNSGAPTYWAGCLYCSVFDNGCKEKVFKIAEKMVQERNYRPYRHDQMPDHEKDSGKYKYWLQSQIRGTVGIVIDILNLNQLL
jgi:hypothetical protein